MTSMNLATIHPRMIKMRCAAIVRIVFPILISFFCISLFLFLSYMIIEGYSVSQMMKTDRDLTAYSIFKD